MWSSTTETGHHGTLFSDQNILMLGGSTLTMLFFSVCACWVCFQSKSCCKCIQCCKIVGDNLLFWNWRTCESVENICMCKRGVNLGCFKFGGRLRYIVMSLWCHHDVISGTWIQKVYKLPGPCLLAQRGYNLLTRHIAIYLHRYFCLFYFVSLFLLNWSSTGMFF